MTIEVADQNQVFVIRLTGHAIVKPYPAARLEGQIAGLDDK